MKKEGRFVGQETRDRRVAAGFLKKKKHVAPVRLIVVSFLILILGGTFLLWLPFSSWNGRFTPIWDSFFTATSATCVTGLAVYDTYTHFNYFGQGVILLLIQVGGLGFATMATGFSVLLRRRLGLRELLLASESASGDSLDIARLLRVVLSFTFACELAGTLLLLIRFLPRYGLLGIWLAIFHSVSAFCNAGFDLMGVTSPGAGMTLFAGDPLVCLTLATLIIIGGIGFVVISDVYVSRLRPLLRREKRVALNYHSVLCLWGSAVLLFSGTVAFFMCEYANTLQGMNFWEKLNTAFFQSTSARTAGFASVNIGEESNITKLFTILLMLIGACPGSTGGGIKITTAVVLVSTVVCTLRGRDEAAFRRRHFSRVSVYRAFTVMASACVLLFIATCALMALNEEISGIDVLFETVSAFATVGLSSAGTVSFGVGSRMILCVLMFVGRVGPLSLFMAFTDQPRRSNLILPEGKLIIG